MSIEEIKWGNNKCPVRLKRRQKKREKRRNKRNRQRTASKTAAMNPTPSIVVFNVSGDSSPVNTQRSS